MKDEPMSNAIPDKVVVCDTTYIRETESHADSPIKIVILQRGWVMVGHYSRDGETAMLDDAKVIRKWGTSKGLGQLVDGPLTDTVLDSVGHVEFHVLAVVAEISCREDAWSL